MSEGTRPQLNPADSPTNVRWMIFGLGCGTSWFLYLHRFTFGMIKPKLAEKWGVKSDELGWLDFAFSFTYSVCQVPAGAMGDLLGAHLFLSTTIIAWSVALALHALPPDGSWMVPVRVLFGIAQAGCYATLSKVSKVWFPRSVRTTMQGWVATFFGRGGGAMSNLLFASVLIGYFSMDWRPALMVFAVGGVLFGIVFAVQYRNSPREHPGTNDAEIRLIEEADVFVAEASRKSTLTDDATNCHTCGAAFESGARPDQCPSCGESFLEKAPAPEKITYRQMFAAMSPRSLRNFGAFLVQQFSSTFADNIYSAWVPFFLWEAYRLKDVDIGIYASLPLFGGAIGGTFGGFLNDYLIRKIGRRWGRTLVGFTGKMLACLLVLAALLNYGDHRVFCILLFFVKFFSDWSQPTVWGTCTDIGGRATATVFGFNNMVGGFGGNVSPVVFGYVALYYEWSAVFALVAGAYVISSLSWLLVDCTIPLMREDGDNPS